MDSTAQWQIRQPQQWVHTQEQKSEIHAHLLHKPSVKSRSLRKPFVLASEHFLAAPSLSPLPPISMLKEDTLVESWPPSNIEIGGTAGMRVSLLPPGDGPHESAFVLLNKYGFFKEVR